MTFIPKKTPAIISFISTTGLNNDTAAGISSANNFTNNTTKLAKFTNISPIPTGFNYTTETHLNDL